MYFNGTFTLLRGTYLAMGRHEKAMLLRAHKLVCECCMPFVLYTRRYMQCKRVGHQGFHGLTGCGHQLAPLWTVCRLIGLFFGALFFLQRGTAKIA